ncbi:hypothetical protein Tco_0272174 [Tanacetum coccineum]
MGCDENSLYPELMYLIVIVAECSYKDSCRLALLFTQFKDVAVQSSKSPLKDLSRNLKLTTYVVPTGKDNFIVSAGRPNMVPAGRTIVSPGSIIVGPGG